MDALNNGRVRRGKMMIRGKHWKLVSPTNRVFPATLLYGLKCDRVAVFRVRRAPFKKA